MRTGRLWLVAGALGALALGSLAVPLPASAAPAGQLHLPDLQSVSPLDQMSITNDGTGRVFRYTHDIANLGDGPLEIQPSYDPATDTAVGTQRLYTHDASGAWTVADQRPIVGRFIYHAIHGHYHYPLAEFGLFSIAADGSVGAPVVMSPKVGFCIADSIEVDASLPHAGPSTHSGGACQDPRATLGITVGWADEYDHRDAGQSIPADNLANGDYWFRSVADPDNYLVEKDETNNVTDVKVRVSGDTVTVLSGAVHPAWTLPTVSLTAPAAGTLTGTTSVTATASDAAGITGVQFMVDGLPLGPLDTAAPYSFSWDTTTAANGGHTLGAVARTARGARNSTAARQVVVANGGGAGTPLSADVTRFVDGRGT